VNPADRPVRIRVGMSGIDSAATALVSGSLIDSPPENTIARLDGCPAGELQCDSGSGFRSGKGDGTGKITMRPSKPGEDGMFNRRWITALATLAFCFAFLPAKAGVCADDYPALLAKVKNFDKTVDFKALRIAYTKTPDYNPYGRDEDKDQAMGKAIEEKRFEEAIKIAQTVLEKNYVHIFAHFISRVAYRELGDQKKFEYHHFVTDGLIQSIVRSGSGMDTDGALLVISVVEEYMILDVLGLKSNKQSTLNSRSSTGKPGRRERCFST
jgi:hypothetical protein